MGIIQLLSKIQNAVVAKTGSPFTVPVKKQLAYISGFSEPKDDIQRGYFQYRAQAMLRGRFVNSVISAASFPVALMMLLKFRRAAEPEIEEVCDNRAVMFRDGKPANILPSVLKEEFSECITDPTEGSFLRKEDLHLIWELICRYPLSWQFVLKCVIKIARYRYAIDKYTPKALIVCNEYSFTSSVLTEFCARNQIELINVMHGEKFLYIHDSFFRFHRCYVWDKYYAQLFKQLRAEETQFRIAVPDSLRFNVSECPDKCWDYTFYLGDEGREALEKLHTILAALQACGAVANVRPHPRYTDMSLLMELYSDIHVENPKEETIEMSVLKSKVVISQFSTVLLQAYYNGVPVVIDDITNPERFAKLEELGYIMLNVEHKLLSQVL